jgi:predicted RNA-binding Zn ribbon-like protein
VRFDHDSERALEEAVLLVNDAGIVASIPDLVAFLDERQYSGTRPRTGAELDDVRRVRARLRAVFDGAAASDTETAVGAINDLIADTGAVPRLVEHDGNPLHLHYTPADAPVADRLGADLAIALAIVVRDGGIERLRVCEAPDCDRVLVDMSRNRSRRYCDAQCANRQHVAAYRERQAAGRIR